MDCSLIKTADLAEKYLHSRLDEAEMDAFETHLLECAACRRQLELLQSAQANLSERAHEIRTWTPVKPFFLRWQTMSVAALVVVVVAGAVAGAFFFRGKETEQTLTVQHIPSADERAAAQEKSNQATGIAEMVAPADVPNSEKRIDGLPLDGHNYVDFSHKNKGVGKTKGIAPKTGAAQSSGINLGKGPEKNSDRNVAEGSSETGSGQESTRVAKTDPRASQPIPSPHGEEAPTLTQAQGVELYHLGSTSAPAFTFSGFTSNEQNAEGAGDISSNARPAHAIDSRRTAFRDAMAAYLEGKYSDASGLLEQAALKEPGALDVQFYLGVCRLLIGQPQRAIEPLTNAAKVSSPVLQQQAHYYLAKAYMQSLRLKEAEDELRIASQLTGPLKNDASGLLKRLQAFRAQLAEN